jgi:predicted transposase/invertase (TIGR01784 family)
MAIAQTNPVIADACDYVLELNKDAEWVKKIAKIHEEGKRYALETLRENSYREGFTEGEAKGEAKGKAETQREIVKNMLLNKDDVEAISKATGISVDEVRKLVSTF